MLKEIVENAVALSRDDTETLYQNFQKLNNIFYEYFLLQRKVYDLQKQINKFNGLSKLAGHKLLKFYIGARLDIKNSGEHCDLSVVDISDPNSNILSPNWFSHKGKGYVIKSENGSLRITVKCLGNGKFSAALRANDFKTNGGRRIPLYIDCLEFTVNGEKVVGRRKPVSHDKPALFTANAENGDIFDIYIEWEPCDIRKLEG